MRDNPRPSGARRISHPRFIAALTALALFAAVILAPRQSPAAASAHMPDQLWYAIELQGTPIGGDHEVYSTVRFAGRLCRLTTSTTRSSVKLFGQSVDQDVVSRDWEGYSSGKPIYEEVVMSSSGVQTTVTASFSQSSVTAVMTSGGHTETKLLRVPAGCKLIADDPTMMVPPAVQGGRAAPTFVYFDPATIAIEPVTIKAVGKSSGRIPRTLQVDMPTGDVTVTQDRYGIPIRIDLPIGLSVVRATQAMVAPLLSDDANGSASPAAAPDFAVVTSVVPTGAALVNNPAQLTAVVTVKGEAPRQISLQSQSALVSTLSLSTPDTQSLPASVAPYLQNSSYLGLDSPAIKACAQNIANGRTNRYAIAVQTERWVHQNMTATASLGLPRSAVEILTDRRGVCRDYALLYTALARSAGVPTKICAGLVGYDGRFYYHAWAESYIGGAVGWLTVDPTLDEIPVDASHIPLVEGDPAKLYDLVGKIGEISINILSCS